MNKIITRSVGEIFSKNTPLMNQFHQKLNQLNDNYGALIELLNKSKPECVAGLRELQSNLSAYKSVMSSETESLVNMFCIPAYQRGYRWTKIEVEHLLNDISEFDPSQSEWYCLQPIVIKYRGIEDDCHSYDLIDGQQRLTSIYLIAKYLHLANELVISYETRDGSANFLRTVSGEVNEENVDFYNMSHAYITIIEYFKNNNQAFKEEFIDKLVNKTRFIWYELESSTDSIDAFSRLNMGKIRLTNAELIKAELLAESNGMSFAQRAEIARDWDAIELKLQDDDFLAFITSSSKKVYATRIDAIFEMWYYDQFKISTIKDEFAVYEVFKLKEEAWSSVKLCYETLLGWYENHEIFHLMAYLGIVYPTVMKEFYSSRDKKCDLQRKIHEKISESIKGLEIDIDLNGDGKINGYDSDYSTIRRALILFNILTCMNANAKTMRYPLALHYRESWSVEHIYAQNSQELKTSQERYKWIQEQLQLIKDAGEECDLSPIPENELTDDIFEKRCREIINFLTDKGIIDQDIHQLSNLALLSSSHNSSLGNKVFSAKRRQVIEWMQAGNFVPLATQRVFLKFYTKEKVQDVYWSEIDRQSYRDEIKKALVKYINN